MYYIENLWPSIANRIVIYDLESKNEVGDIVSPQDIDPRTCVSQIKDVLYFLGGLFHPSATVQAYNISDQTWIAGVTIPVCMIQCRKSYGPSVVNSKTDQMEF